MKTWTVPVGRPSASACSLYDPCSFEGPPTYRDLARSAAWGSTRAIFDGIALESSPEFRPSSLKPGLTLSKTLGTCLLFPLQLHDAKAYHPQKSHTSRRAAGRQAKALDLGLAPIEGRQPALHVTKPSQIGVGWFLAQSPLSVLELPI